MIIAEHARSLHKLSEDLILDHYLEVLCRRPGALAGSTALAAARAAGAFTVDRQRFWETARRRLGDRPGTGALVGVVLLHRTLSADTVIAGMNAALSLDSCDGSGRSRRGASHPEQAPPLIMPTGPILGDGLVVGRLRPAAGWSLGMTAGISDWPNRPPTTNCSFKRR